MKKATQNTGRKRRKGRRAGKSKPIAAAPVTAEDLRALKAEIEKRLGRSATVAVGKQRTAAKKKGSAPMRWNPEPEDVQKSVAQLVLTIV